MSREPGVSGSSSDGGGVAGFVLAGGESRRMGRDKALVDFGGQPLVVRALNILRRAGLSPSIAGARTTLDVYAEVVEDREPGLGPLSGMVAALEATSSEMAVFLSVDLPLLPASLIEYMVYHARISGNTVTVAAVQGFPQTFPAVVRREALPVLKDELQARRLGCFSAFRLAAAAAGDDLSVLPVEHLVQAGVVEDLEALPATFWFLNTNSDVEVERALGMAGPRLLAGCDDGARWRF